MWQSAEIQRLRRTQFAWNAQQRRSVWGKLEQTHQHPESYSRFFQNFAQKIKSVHGLRHMFLPRQNYKLRVLWCCAFFAALSVLIYVCYLLSVRYQRKQYQSVIASAKAPIQSKPFPVVIVCNKNRLNWSRLPYVTEKYHISENQTALFEKILTAYDGLRFGNFERFNELASQPLMTLNHVNFTSVAEDMTWRCDELLSNCVWQTQSYNCCDLFRPRRTLFGSCLAFNEYERRHTAEFGRNTGLKADLMLREDQHAPQNLNRKGFLMSVLEADVWFSDATEIAPNTRIYLSLNLVFHYYEENTRLLEPLERDCIFQDEQQNPIFKTLLGIPYMFENCQAECQQQYMLHYCGCTLDLFYPPGRHLPCQVASLPCLSGHNYRMQYFEQTGEREYAKPPLPGMNCNCLFNCESLTLLQETQMHILKPNELIEGVPYSKLNVYHGREGMLIYKTSLIHTWVELMVSFGGIFVLCLGCSIVSLVEIGYFLLLDLPIYTWKRQHQQ